ncbi:hypothetical protein KFL_001240130 [Klebsormidium nitens]|uniref:Oleosin n=1 Tax=Klebsormidium nitens TaxID=105231 RepID=A0A1Y1HYH8_KLENI|nr:hypothetical protein KFL_001240130 [Klebsormidium nitens]|eukprot:GAQ82782.1 hypothetical protein KFL_001240130 [Klebsormidium nitens]
MSGRGGDVRERAERGAEHAEEQFGQAVGKPREEWRPRDVWAFRILVGGTILTLATVGAIAFGMVAIPTVLIGGGLLLLFSPVLLGIAAITSPIWGPIAALALAAPPVLGGLTLAAVLFGLSVYWFWNFIRSSKTKKAPVDLYEGAKEATQRIPYVTRDITQKGREATEYAQRKAREAGQRAGEGMEKTGEEIKQTSQK